MGAAEKEETVYSLKLCVEAGRHMVRFKAESPCTHESRNKHI